MAQQPTFFEYVTQTHSRFLGGMFFPHSPGHMVSELDNFLRMRHLGEISAHSSYLGVFKKTPLDIASWLTRMYPDLFGNGAQVKLVEDDDLFRASMELQVANPELQVDVGLSHFKVALTRDEERKAARLVEFPGGPRPYYWLTTQRSLADANIRWHRRLFESGDFCPFRNLPPLSPELVDFIGGSDKRLALIHARHGGRAGADNAGLAPPPETMLPTLSFLVDHGFTVVKIGLEPCPEQWLRYPILNYSSSALRNFGNDLQLMRTAAVALFNGTGFSNFADIVGTPMVSYGHWHLPWLPVGQKAVVVPGLMRQKSTGRTLRFSEQVGYYMNSPELWEPGNAINFPHADYDPVPPTGDEILAGVIEALSLSEAQLPRTPSQEKFFDIDRRYLYRYCRSRVSHYFLEKHQGGLMLGYDDGAQSV